MSNSEKHTAEAAPVKVSKRRRSRKGKKNAAQEEDDLIDLQIGVNAAFSKMDSQLLADYIAQKTNRFGTKLSPIELADLSISAGEIRDTTSWHEQRTTEKLPAFLEEFVKDPKELETAPEEKGTPHTIIVTGAGLRAADIVRVVRKYQNEDNAVSKLFAKHVKIGEQTKFLKKHRTGIAVGTPTRLSELIENGVLSVAKLERIVVDASHVDQKKRGVLDMKDTAIPLVKLLVRKEFKVRYTAEKKSLGLLFY